MEPKRYLQKMKNKNKIGILTLVCFSLFFLTECSYNSTLKLRKYYLTLNVDSAQFFGILYKDSVVHDEYIVPDNKVDVIYNDSTIDVIEKMNIKGLQVLFKSKYVFSDSLNYFRGNELIYSSITIDSITYRFDTLNLQPEYYHKNYNGLPLMNFYEPNPVEARYYKNNENKYLILRGNILGCNGRYCNGYYFIFIDLSKKIPEFYVFDYRYAYPFSFKNIIIRRNEKEKYWGIYDINVDNDNEPDIKVSMVQLKLKNGKALIDALEQPIIESYNYNWLKENPNLKMTYRMNKTEHLK